MIYKHQQNITDFIDKVYFAYFGIQLGDQDKCWAPHKVCYVCVEDLRKWSKGLKRGFRFGNPMVWREQTNHSDNCYFCCTDISVYNSKNKQKIIYPNLPSAIRAIPHGPGIPIPQPPELVHDIVIPTTH